MGTRRKPNTAAAQPVTNLFNIMETINSKDIEIGEKSELIEKLKSEIQNKNIFISCQDAKFDKLRTYFKILENSESLKKEVIENLRRKNDLKSETIENLKQSLIKVNLENQEFKKRSYKLSECGQFLELPRTAEPTLQTRIGNRSFTIIFIILFFAAMFILNLATFLNTDLIIKFILK